MLKVSPFRQRTGYCGPASLKMVMRYYGFNRTEKEIARLSGASKTKGTTPEGLVRTAKKFKFNAFVKENCKIKHIRKYLNKGVPLIVAWFSTDDQHYSVVVGIGRDNIYLQDPELGHMRAMSLKTFKRVWFDFPGDFMESKDKLKLRMMVVVRPSQSRRSKARYRA